MIGDDDIVTVLGTVIVTYVQRASKKVVAESLVRHYPFLSLVL